MRINIRLFIYAATFTASFFTNATTTHALGQFGDGAPIATAMTTIVEVAVAYSHVDPDRVIKDRPLQNALWYFDQNRESFNNQNVITVIDMTLPSSKPRMHIVDMNTGLVKSLHTSHGVGSDPADTGVPYIFKNVDGSRATSVGFYRVENEAPSPKFGRAVELEGLSPNNSRAKDRQIIIHRAPYVTPEKGRVGRSWGCPAVSNKDYPEILKRLTGGSLLYIWGGPQFEN